MKVHKDKVREVIGPGGKTIRGIIEATGVTIDVEDNGAIVVSSVDEKSAQRAMQMVRELTQEAESWPDLPGDSTKDHGFWRLC